MIPKNLSKSTRFFTSVLLLVFFMQLQSCGDENPITSLACEFNHPFLCPSEGDLKFVNSSTSRSIVRIYLVENCSAGWGSGTAVSVAPTGSITYTLDADEKYNVKADWVDACDTKFGIKIPHGGEKEQILTRDPSGCNISATAC